MLLVVDELTMCLLSVLLLLLHGILLLLLHGILLLLLHGILQYLLEERCVELGTLLAGHIVPAQPPANARLHHQVVELRQYRQQAAQHVNLIRVRVREG